MCIGNDPNSFLTAQRPVFGSLAVVPTLRKGVKCVERRNGLQTLADEGIMGAFGGLKVVGLASSLDETLKYSCFPGGGWGCKCRSHSQDALAQVEEA